MKKFIALVLLAVASPLTLALDGKIYTAASCTQSAPDVKYTADFVNNFNYTNHIKYTAAGWAYNTYQGDSVTVICPVVREHHAAKLHLLRITAINWNTNEDLSCLIRALDEQGAELGVSDTIYFQSTSEDQQPVIKELVSNQLMGQSFPWAAFIIECKLPRFQSNSTLTAIKAISAIVGYMVDEDN